MIRPMADAFSRSGREIYQFGSDARPREGATSGRPAPDLLVLSSPALDSTTPVESAL